MPPESSKARAILIIPLYSNKIHSYVPDFWKFLHLWTGKKFRSFHLVKNQGYSGKVCFGRGARSATIMTLRKVKGGIRKWKGRSLSFGGKFESPLQTTKKKDHTGRLPRMSKTLLGHPTRGKGVLLLKMAALVGPIPSRSASGERNAFLRPKPPGLDCPEPRKTGLRWLSRPPDREILQS